MVVVQPAVGRCLPHVAVVRLVGLSGFCARRGAVSPPAAPLLLLLLLLSMTRIAAFLAFAAYLAGSVAARSEGTAAETAAATALPPPPRHACRRGRLVVDVEASCSDVEPRASGRRTPGVGAASSKHRAPRCAARVVSRGPPGAQA